MKILMVSIFAPHFFNWTEQLKDSGHEVYWLDVFDSNTRVMQIDFVDQIIGWRYKWNYPGRYFVKKELHKLNKFINKFNERDLVTVFEKKLEEINPDVVHSFVMYLGTAPILEVMKNHPEIKWIYSSWGSDLFYYRNQPKHLKDMNLVFPDLDFMFSDCQRDYLLANEHGFKGNFLGVFPGRGGFNFKMSDPLLKSFEKRNTLLIKGYQGKHGRCIPVLEAILRLKTEFQNYKIVVFGADIEVAEFVENSEMENWNNLVILRKISELEVLKLMGQSLIYIGNSLSDGMPNTLLEAIIMGAYPVQSNPGGATEEIIVNGKNGLLIENPENVDEIRDLIQKAISDKESLKRGIEYNFKNIKPQLERETVKKQVLKKYRLIEKNLKK
jgi:glycosyltransferase involved in cell wall biosynthesis